MDVKAGGLVKPVAKLDIFHGGTGEEFIEGVGAEDFGFEGEIAGEEISPAGDSAGEQRDVGELELADVEPAHEGRDDLTVFSPLGDAEGGGAGGGVLLMEAEMLCDEGGGCEDVVADHEAEGRGGEGNGGVAGAGGAGVGLTEAYEAERRGGLVAGEQGRGLVSGAIVTDDNVEVSEGLALKMLKAGEQCGGAVVGGDDDRDGGVSGLRAWLHGIRGGAEIQIVVCSRTVLHLP